MGKAFCNVMISPMRAENNHRSEMVSEILYGECVEILEQHGEFTKIKMDFDSYEGWVDYKQLTPISEQEILNRKTQLITQPFGLYDLPEGRGLLSIGSEVFFPVENLIKDHSPESFAETAKLFLNVPYLWGGRSFFGIDCSGFSQLVYKVHGISLPRDADQQAEKGIILDFIEESQPGDLAFFDDENGHIYHVGILLSPSEIIHASGKVRMDDLDYAGIYNKELGRHTHKLRFIKRML